MAKKKTKKGIISFIALKGGSGKTTICCCLAAQMYKEGHSVTLIDNDPQRSLTEWHENEGKIHEIPLITDSSSKALDTAIDMAEDSLVFIDTPGQLSEEVIAMMDISQIIIIPCRGSGIDARSALKTIELAKEVNKEKRKNKAKIRVLMNAMNRATISGHIRNELAAAGANVLGCELGQRAIYSEAELEGSAPCFMGSSGKKATLELEALATEIL
jgi:chromosome partitioning protein